LFNLKSVAKVSKIIPKKRYVYSKSEEHSIQKSNTDEVSHEVNLTIQQSKPTKMLDFKNNSLSLHP
jgi:hypothetical protein